MNKRALIGKLLIIALIVIIVMGTTLYFNFSKNKASVTAGKVTVSLDYEDEIPEEEIHIEELEDENITSLNTTDEGGDFEYEDVSGENE